MTARETRLGGIVALLLMAPAVAAWSIFAARAELPLWQGAAVSAAAFVALLAAARRGQETLFVAAAGSVTLLVALACSFGRPYAGTSPLRVDVVLGPWAIAAAAAAIVAATLLLFWRGRSRFGLALFVLFAITWVVLSLNVFDFRDWVLENLLTVPFALLIFYTHRWFRLSKVSYAAIYLFMCMHVAGTHYTYGEVPLGFWLRDALALERNHYDRIVHFAFGLLLVYPMREVAVRIGALRGFWGLYVPIETMLAASAIYEILEWLIVGVFGDLGIVYLGTQGDEWDAVKDMALAGLGACITMGFVFAAQAALRGREFLAEVRTSLRVRQRTPLGEEALRRMRDGGQGGV